ncbi:hypothetical protein GCM10007384_25140 [Aquimarina muelleri]|uniref:Uncharacterized protein n=1 Tax=Aquimarina muelleri TaxID=279356 RepID=A0A918JVG1_9FLAO|nr:hypothetical protein GCM10007384_25140 [Aquimarina muelleri]
MPSYKKPQVVSSLIQIGNSGKFLRFEYQQTSECLKFWKNFPCKKSDIIIENNEDSNIELVEIK